MSKEKKERILNVNLHIDAIAAARRNASSIEETALEVPTVDPKKICLDDNIYTLKAVPVNDKIKGKKKEFAPKVIAIKSFIVNSLSNTVKEGCITINGTLDVPKTGNRVVKLEECLFESEDDARAVAEVLTQVELEKATEMLDEATEAVNFLKKIIDEERY